MLAPSIQLPHQNHQWVSPVQNRQGSSPHRRGRAGSHEGGIGREKEKNGKPSPGSRSGSSARCKVPKESIAILISYKSISTCHGRIGASDSIAAEPDKWGSQKHIYSKKKPIKLKQGQSMRRSLQSGHSQPMEMKMKRICWVPRKGLSNARHNRCKALGGWGVGSLRGSL